MKVDGFWKDSEHFWEDLFSQNTATLASRAKVKVCCRFEYNARSLVADAYTEVDTKSPAPAKL